MAHDMHNFLKVINYGVMLPMISNLPSVLNMNPTIASMIALKIGIIKTTKSSLGSAILLCFLFVSSLVNMNMPKMFRISLLVVIPLQSSLMSINFGVCLSL